MASPNEQRKIMDPARAGKLPLHIFSFQELEERMREMELWSQWGSFWETQEVWLRQLGGVLEDFRRCTDSFLINEGALTPALLNWLWVQGYSAACFDWKHESVTYELSAAFLLIGSGGKGQEDGWRRARKRWVAKNAGGWTQDLKGFAGQAFGEGLKAYKVSDAFPGLIFLSLFTNMLRSKLHIQSSLTLLFSHHLKKLFMLLAWN